MFKKLKAYGEKRRAYIDAHPTNDEVFSVLTAQTWKTRDRIFEQINKKRALDTVPLMEYESMTEPAFVLCSHKMKVMEILRNSRIWGWVEVKLENEFTDNELEWAAFSEVYKDEEDKWRERSYAGESVSMALYRSVSGGPGDKRTEEKVAIKDPLLV